MDRERRLALEGVSAKRTLMARFRPQAVFAGQPFYRVSSVI